MTFELPRMFRVRQRFDSTRIDDVRKAVENSLEPAALRFKPGAEVAIAIGSRGIAQIATIAKTVVEAVRRAGGTPFIVPAMGSHGGGTAAGQLGLLASYSITPESMQCELRSSMDTVVSGTTAAGTIVHCDANAAAADHVILVNRIKPHTRISGQYESGLVKMMLIGLGKHRGAAEYHRAMTGLLFDDIAAAAIPIVMSRLKVLGGVAIVENAFDEVASVQWVAAEKILSEEPKLLDSARANMPRLPFADADLVIIDRFGKNISGTGMDTNIVGRKTNDKVAGPDEWPKVHQIYVRGLTPESKGNASGIGIAEYCRTQIVRQMDVNVTQVNCLTALHINAAAIPAHWETDREVLQIASDQAGRRDASELRWLWIRDTLHCSEVLCSEAYWIESASKPDLEAISTPAPIQWDSSGNLIEQFG